MLDKTLFLLSKLCPQFSGTPPVRRRSARYRTTRALPSKESRYQRLLPDIDNVANPCAGIADFMPGMKKEWQVSNGRKASFANMTARDIAGNPEIVGHVKCDAETTGERRPVSAAWQYASSINDIKNRHRGLQGIFEQIRRFFILKPLRPLVEKTNANLKL